SLGDNTSISIDEIREIIDFLAKASHQSANRVVVITADHLTVNCANALLKILEEPPNQTFFILIAKHLSAILPTIRSRCFVVNLSVPTHQDAITWLKQQRPEESLDKLKWQLKVAGGAPLKAQNIAPELLEQSLNMLERLLYAENLLICYQEDAQNWLLSDATDALYLLYYWLTELIRYVTTGITVFSDRRERFTQLAHLSIKSLFGFMNHVLDAIQRLNASGVNKQLLLEALFYEWHALRSAQ
ncbi:MAG TPA: DNA polymerase III subunit delta' C-terminal domain-containing protein, partial [Candidatus Berkiella sp.]|nr:DNA polymerase III subunit delta' C-terminal domain-containing protein [Candidatus Berkiella sp.]